MKFPSHAAVLLLSVASEARLLRDEDARGHVSPRTTMPCAAPTRRARDAAGGAMKPSGPRLHYEYKPQAEATGG